MARAQLKTLCLPRNIIKLILSTATIMYAIKINALYTHGLSEFHYLIDKRNLNELGFLDFVIYQRQNLTHKKLSSSSMRMLDLGEIIVYYL